RTYAAYVCSSVAHRVRPALPWCKHDINSPQRTHKDKRPNRLSVSAAVFRPAAASTDQARLRAESVKAAAQGFAQVSGAPRAADRLLPRSWIAAESVATARCTRTARRDSAAGS